MNKLIFFFLTFGFPLIVYAELLSKDLRELLIQGHSFSCKPVIRKQLVQQGIDPEESKISDYCLCLGHEYFDEFTVIDFKILKEEGLMPRNFEDTRESSRISCAVRLLED